MSPAFHFITTLHARTLIKDDDDDDDGDDGDDSDDDDDDVHLL